MKRAAGEENFGAGRPILTILARSQVFLHKDLMVRLSKALVNWWVQRKYARDQASHDLADATGLTGNKMVNYFTEGASRGPSGGSEICPQSMPCST